ncbi:unnamed protein product [Cuscuta epithymum]|uniref:PWWP domain-containing protein n=1 Tax=Cuscuta epithymum TaxID=186058 RepID=A0AAV0D3I5_9ASTE|nr:unnamed protein product [Cuscuta epithymum]
MATQQESKTAETLMVSFTELYIPKTPGLVPKLDGAGNFGNGFHDVDSVLADGHGLTVEANKVLCDEISQGSRESAMELGEKHTDTVETSKKRNAAEIAQNESSNYEGEGAEKEAGNEVDRKEDSDNTAVFEHCYGVGDFIWGKVKSRPWWPGRIYNPSDASEFAVRYKQAGRLLVVYFGDGSFSWCLPSELKPFHENFEEMSKQSNVETFTNAVDKALDEMRILLELEMNCQCVPLSMPMAVNAGIKPGVLIPPKGDTKLKLSLPYFEPCLVRFNLNNLAQTTSVPNRIELVTFTSWLSAFCRANRGHGLSFYCKPSNIEGLEDKSRNQDVELYDSVVSPIQGLLEGQEVVYSRNDGPYKCPVNADDKPRHHRNLASVSQLLHVSSGSDSQNESHKGKDLHNYLPEALKKRKSLSIKWSGSGAQDSVDTAKEGLISRERKKSKYLSPPYTSISMMSGNSRAKQGFDLESESDKENQLMLLPALYMSTPTSEVLSEVQSAAINPHCWRKPGTLDMIREFTGSFRKSFYVNESSEKVHKSRHAGSKRNSSSSLKENTKAKSEYEETVSFGSIKQSLKILKFLLKRCDGKILEEEKLYLEDEVKVLLKKVSALVAAP